MQDAQGEEEEEEQEEEEGESLTHAADNSQEERRRHCFLHTTYVMLCQVKAKKSEREGEVNTYTYTVRQDDDYAVNLTADSE